MSLILLSISIALSAVVMGSVFSDIKLISGLKITCMSTMLPYSLSRFVISYSFLSSGYFSSSSSSDTGILPTIILITRSFSFMVSSSSCNTSLRTLFVLFNKIFFQLVWHQFQVLGCDREHVYKGLNSLTRRQRFRFWIPSPYSPLTCHLLAFRRYFPFQLTFGWSLTTWMFWSMQTNWLLSPIDQLTLVSHQPLEICCYQLVDLGRYWP